MVLHYIIAAIRKISKWLICYCEILGIGKNQACNSIFMSSVFQYLNYL